VGIREHKLSNIGKLGKHCKLRKLCTVNNNNHLTTVPPPYHRTQCTGFRTNVRWSILIFSIFINDIANLVCKEPHVQSGWKGGPILLENGKNIPLHFLMTLGHSQDNSRHFPRLLMIIDPPPSSSPPSSLLW